MRLSPSNAVITGGLLFLLIVFIRSLGSDEAEVTEQAETVVNTPPEIQSLELVLARGNVVARPLGRDPEGDRFHYRYRWSIGGKPQKARGAMLKKSRIQPGDTIEVEATPVDSHGAEGRPMRSSIAVEGSQR